MEISRAVDNARFQAKWVMEEHRSEEVVSKAKEVRNLAVILQIALAKIDFTIAKKQRLERCYADLEQIAYSLCTLEEGKKAHRGNVHLIEVWVVDSEEKENVGGEMESVWHELAKVKVEVESQEYDLRAGFGLLKGRIGELEELLQSVGNEAKESMCE